MKYLVRRNPNTGNYVDEFDRFFDDFWDFPKVSYDTGRLPSVDVCETEDAYILEAELPGYAESNVDVHVEKHVLHISSMKEETKQKKEPEDPKKGEKSTYILRERLVGSFQRSFALPEQVNEEKISGEFKNGILTLTIPKSPETKPKKIDIKLAS